MATPSEPTPKRIVVLISGNGSNLQALIDAANTPFLPSTTISLVVSNRKAAYGLTRAANANIPTLTMTLKAHKDTGKTREDYDADLAQALLHNFRLHAGGQAMPDLIVLAGFMHIVSPRFLSYFPEGRLINLHPALPGAFDGAHAIERAFAAWQSGEIKETGVMVHRVIAEVDAGEVIVTEVVPFLEGDTLEKVEERIHSAEHGLIVKGARTALGV
ncbi:formyl transferase [Chytriomyces sp. MP71]|nr:formyl transferase [Chytriomyces sp. MP71]